MFCFLVVSTTRHEPKPVFMASAKIETLSG